MTTALYTLYEKNYHLGVAALINSAIATGFGGRVRVGYRGELPPWVDQLGPHAQTDGAYEVQGVEIKFIPWDSARHLGYEKARFGQQLFDSEPDLEAVVYADPDVVFIAPWRFYGSWIERGIALVQDLNFPEVATRHPWRGEWSHLAQRAGVPEGVKCERYPNSGFIGVTRDRRNVLRDWERVTQAYEQKGGDVTGFCMHERWRAVTGDQDLLAACLPAHAPEVAWVGPEGMGFTGYFFLLSHAVESPKPWATRFLRQALNGNKPSTAAKLWLDHANTPVEACGSWRHAWRRLDYKCGVLVSRLWRR